MKKLILLAIIASFVATGCARPPGTIIPGPDGISESKCRAQTKDEAEQGALYSAEIYCKDRGQSYVVHERLTSYEGDMAESTDKKMDSLNKLASAFGSPIDVSGDGSYVCNVKFGCQ